MRKRRKFIKKLKKAIKQGNFKITEIKRPYLSVIFPNKSFNFTVTQGGICYDCKLVAGMGGLDRVTFLADGYLLREHIIKLMRVELLRLQGKVCYSFEAKNKKVIILSPVPKKIMINENGRTHIADVGSNAFGYKIFNGEGFLNALERECLNRFW